MTDHEKLATAQHLLAKIEYMVRRSDYDGYTMADIRDLIKNGWGIMVNPKVVKYKKGLRTFSAWVVCESEITGKEAQK